MPVARCNIKRPNHLRGLKARPTNEVRVRKWDAVCEAGRRLSIVELRLQTKETALLASEVGQRAVCHSTITDGVLRRQLER